MGGLAGAVALGPLAACSGSKARRGRVAPVRVERGLIKRIDVGLRPFRPTGFVVRAERFDEKLVVHNYGHGGAGVTLSWGTADLAVRHVLETEAEACAVVGCGAVGLATARLLQERGKTVTIYARDLPPKTTSNVAPAQWAPHGLLDRAGQTPAFGEQLREAGAFAFSRYGSLRAARYGIRLLDNYALDGERRPGFPWSVQTVAHLFPEVEEVPPEENPFGTAYALRYKTYQIDTGVYLNAMVEDVRAASGTIIMRDFQRLEDILSLPEPVIVNCAGLGSRALFGDEEIFPVKGQLTVLERQDAIDYVITGAGFYMMPRHNEILLGGTFERRVETLAPNAEATERIFRRTQTFFERMTGRAV